MTFKEEVAWSRRHFDSIKLDGAWAIPRSGLGFLKVTEEELQLVEILPYTPKMAEAFAYGWKVPPNETVFREYQRQEFEEISKRFNVAGIRITDPKGLLSRKTYLDGQFRVPNILDSR